MKSRCRYCHSKVQDNCDNKLCRHLVQYNSELSRAGFTKAEIKPMIAKRIENINDSKYLLHKRSPSGAGITTQEWPRDFILRATPAELHEANGDVWLA